MAVLSGLTGDGWLGLRARIRLKFGFGKYVTDRTLGYPVHRTWFPKDVVSDLVEREGADVLVMQSGRPVPLAAAGENAGIPTVLYLRNVETEDLEGDPSSLHRTLFVANSRFTAGWFNERFGIEATVVHPLIQADRYQIETDRSEVVFVNPHPLKGVEQALGVARACPEIPFRFVEAWTLDAEARERLEAEIARLPNVTLMPRTRDMKSVYGKARIVLAPSQWQEAFGRIAAEAHVSGIPVVASRIGGLTEAVGPGGILVDAEAPVEQWADAVRKLWEDQDAYAKASSAAKRHAARPALDPDVQVKELLSVFRAAIAEREGQP